jgi:uncharacterized cupredoxin-like copper-binding protein
MHFMFKCNPATLGLGGLILALSLAACSPPPSFVRTAYSNTGYVEDPKTKTAAINWEKAEKLVMYFSSFKLQPNKIHFKTGQPYEMRLINEENKTHSFKSPLFFRAIAVHHITLLGKEPLIVNNPRIERISLPPGAAVQLHFIPVKTGEYEIYCDEPVHATQGMTAEFTVE